MSKYIVYGLTQSGIISTAANLRELLGPDTVSFLGPYFKTQGDLYMSYNSDGSDIIMSATPHDKDASYFTPRYRSSGGRIEVHYDFNLNNVLQGNKELEYRIKLLKHADTHTNHVMHLSAWHNLQSQTDTISHLLKDQDIKLILVDPTDSLEKIAKDYFYAHKTNLWVTQTPGTVINPSKTYEFSEADLDQFKKEYSLFMSNFNKLSQNAVIIPASKSSDTNFLANILGLSSASSSSPTHGEASFKTNWPTHSKNSFKTWLTQLQA